MDAENPRVPLGVKAFLILEMPSSVPATATRLCMTHSAFSATSSPAKWLRTTLGSVGAQLVAEMWLQFRWPLE